MPHLHEHDVLVKIEVMSLTYRDVAIPKVSLLLQRIRTIAELTLDRVTVARSLKAVKLERLITMIGFLTSPKNDEQSPLMDALNYICMVRGVFVGSKPQFTEMNRAIDSAKIRLSLTSKCFSLMT